MVPCRLLVITASNFSKKKLGNIHNFALVRLNSVVAAITVKFPVLSLSLSLSGCPLVHILFAIHANIVSLTQS